MGLGKQVLVAVGLLAGGGATMAALPAQPGERGPGRLSEELGLSLAQQDEIGELRLEAERGMIRRRADVAVARLDLRQLVTAPTLDEKAVGAKVKELAELEATMLRARVDHILALRKVLTQEQQQKLRSLRLPRAMGRAPLGSPRRGMRGGFGPGSERGEAMNEDGEGPGPVEDGSEIAALTGR